MKHQIDRDCIVIGAGIAGLGAALQLKDAGRDVLVLEGGARVGGRMTTDRMHGYAIDRGVTILSNEYRNMKSLVKRFSLQNHVVPIDFSYGLVEPEKIITFRAGRVDDLLLNNDFSFATKVAVSRLGLAVLANSRRLHHGRSTDCGDLDDMSLAAYMQRLHGMELMDRVLYPGLASVMGGCFEESSRLVLMQTFRNLFLAGSFTMDDGVDLIPEAMAKELNVKLNINVATITYTDSGVVVADTSGNTYTAKTVIMAVPGTRVAGLCQQLPGRTIDLLKGTAYGKMTSMHVGLNKEIPTEHTFRAASKVYAANYEIELERNRCRSLCPEGKDMASVFWRDSADKCLSAMNRDALTQEADKAFDVCLPEMKEHISFRHVVKWEDGIGHFVPGRLKAVSGLRNEMKTWNLPVQLCGDYLDGLSSEGALQTGLEAGNNIDNYLNNRT